MRSGELSRRAGLSTDTLRHYERIGVLPRPPRTNGGYRNYDAGSLERVKLIQSALKVGFSLPELADILRMRDRGELPCQKVRAIAEHKLGEVQEQIKDLMDMRDQLRRLLKEWDVRLARSGKKKPARLLETLPDDLISTVSNPLAAKRRRRFQR